MTTIDIRHRHTGAVMYAHTAVGATLRTAVETAIQDGAKLSRANLSDADLSDADLTGTNTDNIEADFRAVVAGAEAELPALINDGRIDGSVYEGECACLVGTIAKARGVSYKAIPHHAARPIEIFYLRIRPGDAPETHAGAALALRWAERALQEAV